MGDFESQGAAGVRFDQTGASRVGEVAGCLRRDSTTISFMISRLSSRMCTEDRLRKNVEN